MTSSLVCIYLYVKMLYTSGIAPKRFEQLTWKLQFLDHYCVVDDARQGRIIQSTSKVDQRQFILGFTMLPYVL